MKNDIPVELLLRWRLARAESEAPPAPRAARLIAEARPWWETWPERFQSLVERLGRVQIAYGHAMTEPSNPRTGYPVTAVIDHDGQELETFVSVLYFSIRDRRFCFRFHLTAAIQPPVESFETTFISEDGFSPLLSGQATRSVDNEYRVDLQVSDELARTWGGLKVTDHMPFRLILRSGSSINNG